MKDRESFDVPQLWIPAFAGMTEWLWGFRGFDEGADLLVVLNAVGFHACRDINAPWVQLLYSRLDILWAQTAGEKDTVAAGDVFGYAPIECLSRSTGRVLVVSIQQHDAIM